MTIPTLGPRGEGWLAAQAIAGLLTLLLGVLGDRWPAPVRTVGLVAGVGLGAAGLVLAVTAGRRLGSSLSPLPRPTEGASLREDGAYALARHPIYGGLVLLALGWSLARSPWALIGAAALLVVVEAKSRLEERWLERRFPTYPAYRERVRFRLVPWIH